MDKETSMALVRFIVPLLASLATIFGWTLDWEIVLNVLLSTLSLASFAWAWWKNNNVTQAAQEAQGVLDAIKDGTLSDLDVNVLNDGSIYIDVTTTKVGGTE